ncbi:hypothetical protein ABZZ79_29505 [Streptomyces sp. NPDC006458]|uniref:hypothetical protein n=1 Tax=Streptomyces sp. NPDC006458 TaxID=3154302 RepID=UPI0033A14C54
MDQGVLSRVLDPYTWRARVRPVLIAALPVALPLAVLVPAWSSARRVWMLVLVCGLPLLLGQFSRSRGRRLEPGLFDRWGGKPTVQLLRWRGPTAAAQLAYLHARIEQIAGPPLRMPSAEEERSDPRTADAVYEAAGSVLRTRARALPGADLVAEENSEYGFRRNTLGLRPLALGAGAAGLLAALLHATLGRPPSDTTQAAVSAVLVLADLALLAFWIRTVRVSWVEEAAWTYARRLIETAGLPDPDPGRP